VLDVGGEVVRQPVAADVLQESGARISSPDSSTAPDTRPSWVSSLPTLVLVRISAPASRAAAAIASATAPMPPSWKPQLPRWPSPTSPIEWWAIT
jgi:hypothetical protein